VELLLQDFSGNRNINDIQRLFENILEQTGLVIEDIAFDERRCLGGDVRYRQQPVQHRGLPAEGLYLHRIPTAVGVYNSLTYVATKSATNKGTLYRYTGALTVDAINTFTDSDSVINCIANHGIKMYLGFENGNVYSYDGSVLVKVDEMPNPVSSLMSDGSSLYLAMRNDDGVYIYDGSGFVKRVNNDYKSGPSTYCTRVSSRSCLSQSIAVHRRLPQRLAVQRVGQPAVYAFGRFGVRTRKCSR
jgi:hypothetical protein